ncbi:hypothetical protein PENTCL1PPCAC_30702, partial [Pristionchus entomophagus]
SVSSFLLPYGLLHDCIGEIPQKGETKKQKKQRIQGYVTFTEGKLFGEWIVKRKIDEGGFGKVYLMQHSKKPEHTAALKAEPNEVSGEVPYSLQIQVIRALNKRGETPHIPQVFHAAKHRKYCYMIMTLLERTSRPSGKRTIRETDRGPCCRCLPDPTGHPIPLRSQGSPRQRLPPQRHQTEQLRPGTGLGSRSSHDGSSARLRVGQKLRLQVRWPMGDPSGEKQRRIQRNLSILLSQCPRQIGVGPKGRHLESILRPH